MAATDTANHSMPLDWNELSKRPEKWTLLTTPQRLDRLREDPWKDWTSPQSVSAASFRAITGGR